MSLPEMNNGQYRPKLSSPYSTYSERPMLPHEEVESKTEGTLLRNFWNIKGEKAEDEILSCLDDSNTRIVFVIGPPLSGKTSTAQGIGSVMPALHVPYELALLAGEKRLGSRRNTDGTTKWGSLEYDSVNNDYIDRLDYALSISDKVIADVAAIRSHGAGGIDRGQKALKHFARKFGRHMAVIHPMVTMDVVERGISMRDFTVGAGTLEDYLALESDLRKKFKTTVSGIPVPSFDDIQLIEKIAKARFGVSFENFSKAKKIKSATTLYRALLAQQAISSFARQEQYDEIHKEYDGLVKRYWQRKLNKQRILPGVGNSDLWIEDALNSVILPPVGDWGEPKNKRRTPSSSGDIFNVYSRTYKMRAKGMQGYLVERLGLPAENVFCVFSPLDEKLVTNLDITKFLPQYKP